MQPQLPVSRAVAVSVNLAPNAAQAQSLSNLLIMGVSTVIDTLERYRTYATLAAVATDFGTNTAEYLAAQKWFSQSPQPTSVIIGRWFQSAASGGLRCGTLSTAAQLLSAWTAITNGSFSIAKDGAAAVNVTGLNFAAATTMAGVAAIIQAGTGMPAGVTVAWNATYARFEFASTTAGPTSAISYLGTGGGGTDISDDLKGRLVDGAYTYAGAAAETAVSALTTIDGAVGQLFYGVTVLGVVPDNSTGTTALLAVAAYLEGASTKHMLAITTQESGALVAATTTDIAYQLAQLAYKRTLVQYSSSSPYAAISALARILTVNYETDGAAITLKFKQEPGVSPEYLTASQADALRDKKCNVFVAYENQTSILQEGVTSSGYFVDVITGTDWLAITIQRDVYNLLYASTTKIPQTDQGMQMLTAAVEARCAQAVRNGLLAPGVWGSGGFGLLAQGDYLQKGYYVYAAPVSTQPSGNRTARMAMPIQVAAKLAGAVHSADVSINVNQ